MANIDTLTAQLDSLLNDACPDEDIRECRRGEKSRCDIEWEDIDGDVSDILTTISSETNVKTVPSVDPLFPSDIPKSGSQNNLQVQKKEKNNKEQSGHRNIESEAVAAKNVKNNSITASFQKKFLSSSEFAVKTIADLSKKVRDLNSQLAVTQNKLRLAESKVISLKETQVSMKPKEPKEISEDKVSALEKQVKELTEELSKSNIKFCEARNQVQLQKHEIKILQKAIASEIGDNVSMQTLTSDGWRGRAQQIISLQQKVNDLNEKLSQTNIPIAERASSAILLLEKAQDKEKISLLSNELDEVKSALSEMTKKNDQARARIKVLVSELNSFKAKYEAQNMKNDEDVKLINTLTARLTNMSQKFHEREKNLVSEYEERLNSLHNEFKQEKLKADQLKKIVIERDSKIEKLEEKVKQFHTETKYEERPPSSWSAFQNRPQSRQSSLGGGTLLPSTELERMRLMELVTVLNRRLEDERKALENLQEELRQEKHRSVRLETKCSRLELEKVGRGGYSRRSASTSTSRSSDTSKAELSAAKDRIALLEEKILALESRIDRLRKEKEEDSRIYVRMVEDARQAMRDHMRKGIASSNMSLP